MVEVGEHGESMVEENIGTTRKNPPNPPNPPACQDWRRRISIEALLVWTYRHMRANAINEDGVSLNTLAPPEAVRRATSGYRMDSDKIGPFLASACIITGRDEHAESAADLWHAYAVWCRRNGARADSQNWLGRRLTERKGVRREGRLSVHLRPPAQRAKRRHEGECWDDTLPRHRRGRPKPARVTIRRAWRRRTARS